MRTTQTLTLENDFKSKIEGKRRRCFLWRGGVECGESHSRNLQYEENYNSKKFHRELLNSQAPVIFDVGAHHGEALRFYKGIFPDATIYCFEPSPTDFAVLERTASDYKNVNVFNFAIGADAGFGDFYLQDISHLNSLLPVNHNSEDSLGYAKTARNEQIRVKIESIDSFCNSLELHKIDLLKIDVQGGEVQVLQGAKNALGNLEALVVEISLYDFYEKEDRFTLLKIEEIMATSAMAMWDISKISKNPNSLRTDWFEAVYRRIRH